MATHELVLNNPLAFPKLTKAQIKLLSQYGKLVKFKEGKKLYKAGQKDYLFYVIKKGKVGVIDPATDKFIVSYGAGHFTGELNVLTGSPSMLTTVAIKPTEAYAFSSADVRHILSEFSEISDILLTAFLLRRQLIEQTGVISLLLIASRYSRDTHRLREFLTKNKVLFTWIDLENDPNVNKLLKQFKITPDETPVVVCKNGGLLRNPSNSQLASCLGISKPVEHTLYDLVIIGAGPAGLAAAVYGASEGLNTVVLDSVGPGGQAGNSSKIENYMGFPIGLSGNDLASRAIIQAEKFGATLLAASEVIQLNSEKGVHKLSLENGEEVLTKCVLISTGVLYRKLNVPGCEQYEGKGVYYAATQVEAQLCRNAQVIVVGDGNSAGQAAVFLSGFAKKVFILILRDKLGEHMSSYLVNRISKIPNIEVRPQTQISNMYGDKGLTAVDLTSAKTKQTEKVSCAATFVFIGAAPHTAWLKNTVDMDDLGYIKTGPSITKLKRWPLKRGPYFLETTTPGVFAAGDVRFDSIKRVASAVGEGATAVLFVHKYLGSV